MNRSKYFNYELSGWNIVNFDLPMLTWRAAVNNIKVPHNIDAKNGWYNNSFDAMTFLGKGMKSVSLNEAARAFGLNPKIGHGTDVNDWYKNKEWDKIKEYCEHDVYITGEIIKRII